MAYDIPSRAIPSITSLSSVKIYVTPAGRLSIGAELIVGPATNVLNVNVAVSVLVSALVQVHFPAQRETHPLFTPVSQSIANINFP